MSAGLDSIAATELANLLAERLGTKLPQTVLFDHPTIGAVASFAAGSLANQAPKDAAVQIAYRANESQNFDVPTEPARAIVSLACKLSVALPGPCYGVTELKELTIRACATNSRVPVLRWPMIPMRRKTEAATYGAFLGDIFTSVAAAFGISRTEAGGLDPAAMLILEAGYGALHDPSGSSLRARLANAPVGVFLGAGGSVAS